MCFELRYQIIARRQWKPNVKHCFGSLDLIVTWILNYMNNYNQGNYPHARFIYLPHDCKNIKTESVRKLSNFNFQWTNTLYQI